MNPETTMRDAYQEAIGLGIVEIAIAVAIATLSLWIAIRLTRAIEKLCDGLSKKHHAEAEKIYSEISPKNKLQESSYKENPFQK